jgi:hypothetical protein
MEIDDELGMKLHDKATRGQALSEEEQAQLQAWYDAKDREEAEMLRLSPLALVEAEIVTQTRQMIALITKLTRQNEVIARQNESLLAEIASLRHQLASRASTQTG